MAAAYICDRCGDAKQGRSEARVFLESHIATRDKSLARVEDLCSSCTTEIKDCILRKPPRVAGQGLVGQ